MKLDVYSTKLFNAVMEYYMLRNAIKVGVIPTQKLLEVEEYTMAQRTIVEYLLNNSPVIRN